MRIDTIRFGEVEISDDRILRMDDGMLGFDPYTRFVLLKDRSDESFYWLQSVDNSALAFAVIDPIEFFFDYDINISDDDAKSIGLTSPADAKLVTTVTIDREGGLITTNLLGPVVINLQTLQAKQIVLQDDRYGTKHLIGKVGRRRSRREMAA